MKNQFIIYTALRYFKARRKSRGFASSILSILGVAVGVFALTVIIAVMNGFQLSYINNILEISSFHLQLEQENSEQIDQQLLKKIKDVPGITAVVPFSEFQALVNRNSSYSQTVGGIVRAVGKSELAADPGFYKSIFSEDDFDQEYLEQKFAIDEPNSIVIGNLFEYTIGARKGSELILTAVNDFSLRTKGEDDVPAGASNRYIIKEVFKSGYSEIDLNYIFMSLDSAQNIISRDGEKKPLPIVYGIKLGNRFDDLGMKQKIETIIGSRPITVKTWRDFNQGFFGALLMEKIAMMILVGLIFIVVGFNIFNSLRRIVYEKFEEIGVLKAIGASPGQIKAIFIFEGFLIGFIGGIIGLVSGLIVSSHINETFSILTQSINFFIGGAESALSVFVRGFRLDRVMSPFSSDVFYLQGVPSKVIFEEALLIFFFAVFSASAAAFVASRKITEVKPAEVLRYE
ncbi:MAG: ABC transporter permease [Spirochaetales bacterium]|nr:ABC transporter permease [Spirochaetales bacterium]